MVSQLTPSERKWLSRVRDADTLSDLARVVDADSAHEAYLTAKPEWKRLRDIELDDAQVGDGLPGDCVTLDKRRVCVHGITHTDTDAERSFLRDHVDEILDGGGAVYCEQGIRRMYFADMDPVCETDDYEWAMERCRNRDDATGLAEELECGFEEDSGVNLQALTGRLREMAFSLIDGGSEVYGERFTTALGDVATDFLVTHEDIGTGRNFTAFRKTRLAATDPTRLADLQRYYMQVFLPHPLENEWVRRHDPELNLFTHARNERITAYVLAHTDTGPVHIITGAAHQPGICYYLTQFRDGAWSPEFEPLSMD